MVIGDQLNCNDFYILANLLEDYPNLLKIYKFKYIDPESENFISNSPPYSNAMIGKNIYFENQHIGTMKFSVAKVIENVEPSAQEKYKKIFDEYKEVSKELTSEDLRKFAKRKEREDNKQNNLDMS